MINSYIIIEMGALSSRQRRAKLLKKQFDALPEWSNKRNRLYFDVIEKEFPDSSLYFGGEMCICVPTAVNLTSEIGKKFAMESLRNRNNHML